MAKFDDLAPRYMAKLIEDFALLPFQAAGPVGNGGEESGGFEKIQEISPTSGRGGLGHFQWTGPRRRDFEAWLARNEDKGWHADTFEANYSMLYRELAPGGPEHVALLALKNTTTLEQATQVFMDKFERPGVPALDVRLKWARRALAAYEAHPNPITPAAHDILPPLPKIDPNTLAPLINAALPVLLQLLAARKDGHQPDILSILLPLLSGGQSAPPPPSPPQPTVEVVVPKPKPKTSVAVGLTGLFGSLAAMIPGWLGTPLGMGTAPTTAGNLVPLAFGAIAAIGSTGVFGPWGAVASRIIGAVANKPKT